MAREWVDGIKTACQRQRVAFFFKQWGGKTKKFTGRMLDGQTLDEYPKVAMHAG